MKASKAPEKIHVQPNAHDRWFEGKIPSGLPNGLFVEYTRTDDFIEKAVEWWMDNFVYTDDVEIKYDTIQRFKNYMKGE